MPPVLQSRLPVAPWMAPHTMRLPGTVPIAPQEWLLRDEVFGQQMALRDQLIAERPEAVHAMEPGCAPAAEELLAVILARLQGDDGYRREGDALVRPDGVRVGLGGPALVVAGRLVQEDLLVLARPEGAGEHRLTGGILCFPSNWTLREKLGTGLARIHAPIGEYDEGIARRVQRLFDGLRPEAPLCRANLLIYGTSELFNPRREGDRHKPGPGEGRFVRVERQCLVKLPASQAVVFSIHTYLVRAEALTAAQRAALIALRPDALADPLPED